MTHMTENQYQALLAKRMDAMTTPGLRAKTTAEYDAEKKPGRRPIGRLSLNKVVFGLDKYHCNEHEDGLPVGGFTQWTVSTHIGRVVFSCGCEMVGNI